MCIALERYHKGMHTVGARPTAANRRRQAYLKREGPLSPRGLAEGTRAGCKSNICDLSAGIVAPYRIIYILYSNNASKVTEALLLRYHSSDCHDFPPKAMKTGPFPEHTRCREKFAAEMDGCAAPRLASECNGSALRESDCSCSVSDPWDMMTHCSELATLAQNAQLTPVAVCAFWPVTSCFLLIGAA